MIQFGDEDSKLLEFDDAVSHSPGANIKVVGVGGAGGNAVNRMIEAGISGVDFIVANTDAQALRNSKAPVKIHIGGKVTKGLGAGAKPEIGREAALEDTNNILEHIEGADMVFVTAGLGGGTGTGAAPIIASLATELGALVVAVVTTPFTFEGPRRRRNAESGLRELKGSVDTVITISNDKLLTTIPDKTPFNEAFRIADDVLRQAVQGISDLINVPGIINLDFADVKTIMQGMGVALMGCGTATGENRALEAAQMAISSPLLEENSVSGAKGVLLNIVGGPDLTMSEINEAATLIHETCDPDAEIIFGAVTDEKYAGTISVTVIATGFSTPSRELAEEEYSNVEAFPERGGRQMPRTPPRVEKADYGQTQRRPAPEPPVSRRQEQATRTLDPGAQSKDFDYDLPAPSQTMAQRPVRNHQSPNARPAQPRDPRDMREYRERDEVKSSARPYSRANRNDDHFESMRPQPTSEFVTPQETIQEVLMTPQNYGANNMGFDDENDLDIPTYLRNMKKMRK